MHSTEKKCFVQNNLVKVITILLIIAKKAAFGNLVLSFMSAWIVGKVDAPANENIIELKAEFFDINDRLSAAFYTRDHLFQNQAEMKVPDIDDQKRKYLLYHYRHNNSFDCGLHQQLPSP